MATLGYKTHVVLRVKCEGKVFTEYLVMLWFWVECGMTKSSHPTHPSPQILDLNDDEKIW
jgi:hypothetical protein